MKIKKNPDEKRYQEISNQVKENDGFCPCRLVRNEDTKCMCKEFRESTAEGYCHCGLFYKEKDW